MIAFPVVSDLFFTVDDDTGGTVSLATNQGDNWLRFVGEFFFDGVIDCEFCETSLFFIVLSTFSLVAFTLES